MNRLIKRCAVVLVVSAPLVGGILPALSCDYHRGGSAGNRSPRAMELIAAMRDPANAQALGASALAPRLVNLLGFHQATRKLQRLRESLEQAANEQRPQSSGFSLLFAEVGLWTRYVLDDKGVRIELDTVGPGPTETVVTTGEPVITAIASGQLSPSEAYRRNLIVADGASVDRSEVFVWLRNALAVLQEQM
jgi:hypothetical protein